MFYVYTIIYIFLNSLSFLFIRVIINLRLSNLYCISISLITIKSLKLIKIVKHLNLDVKKALRQTKRTPVLQFKIFKWKLGFDWSEYWKAALPMNANVK